MVGKVVSNDIVETDVEEGTSFELLLEEGFFDEAPLETGAGTQSVSGGGGGSVYSEDTGQLVDFELSRQGSLQNLVTETLHILLSFDESERSSTNK